MRIFPFSVFLSLILSCFALQAEEQGKDSDFLLGVLNFFDTIPEPEDTVSDFVVVYGSPISGTGKNKMPSEIINVVQTFYLSKDVSVEITEGVLDFLSNAYSEHDYHESGSWVKESTNYHRYIPYEGELPSYTVKDFVSPVKGRITSGYGYRSNRMRNHYGIDISLNIGDTVRCALPGVVTRKGYERRGYGHYIVVAHSGELETIYAHMSTTIAEPGQMISSGDAVGLGGSTGNSTGPHLHFETRVRGRAVSPYDWMNF